MTEPHVPLPSLSEALPPLRAALDSLRADQRLWWMRGLSGGELRALWELACAQPLPVDLDWLAPKPGRAFHFEGQNNLPIFSTFQKRFYLPENGQMLGYNHTSGLVTAVAGPGYFLVSQESPEVIRIDYTTLPTPPSSGLPAGWPVIVDNDGGARGLVFGGMVDRLRQVSADCAIGRAWKKGAPQRAYFMLTRVSDPAAA
jgi:hypothetical protein